MNLTRMYPAALRGLRPHQADRHIRQLQASIVLQLFRGLKGKENVTVSIQDLRESFVEWRRK